MSRTRLLWSSGTTAMLAAVLLAAAAFTSGEDRLLIRLEGGPGTIWWRAASAPTRWDGRETPLADAMVWNPGAQGIEWGELQLGGPGEARALRLIAARLDPAETDLSLAWGLGTRPRWLLDSAPASAALAVNAGMFVDALPWGWVVIGGRERLAPGHGPLSSALVVRRDGTVAWIDGDDLSSWRGNPDVAFAFQSYPTLLTGDGDVPPALRDGDLINRGHRDARLALGIDREGRLIVALTRLDAPLPGAERIPFGLTVPEMAAVMGALGARQAVSLDGGISAQLLLRDAAGAPHRWPGLRPVSLALLATPREAR